MNDIHVSLSVDSVGALALALDRDEPLSIALGDTYIDGGAEEYEGEYVVIPKVATEQVLETKYKKMSDDVTVRAIPDARVTNLAGGYTVTIGAE